MPLDRQTLLNIIRDNADEDGSADKRIWEKWHVDAALAIIFGGAQFREGTDLWATKKVGMMPAPDFGRQLSFDRFQRILRYWARGMAWQRNKLRLNPWAQIDNWVKGFNDARLREIKIGSCVTPDEMMLEWKGRVVLVGYRTCLTSNENQNLWGLNSRVCVRGQWESAFI
jgi:hypothetical protein